MKQSNFNINQRLILFTTEMAVPLQEAELASCVCTESGTRWKYGVATFRLYCVSLMVVLLLTGHGFAQKESRTALDDYIAQPNTHFNWSLVKTEKRTGYTAYQINLISQSWRSTTEVSRPIWQHWMTVIVPDQVNAKVALLGIGGGINRPEPTGEPRDYLVQLALKTHTVVVDLPCVPNQPLRFIGTDRKLRVEDDLLVYSWNRYFDTGDATWIAHFAMVNSAVRAMDATQQFLSSKAGGEIEVTEFVVTGASKRGWTTWLTGATDKRVKAIIPIVIDVLNLRANTKHHYAAYGFFAPALNDYVRGKIMEREGTKRYAQLLKMVDPISYVDRLKLPKYLVNSTGDQFFLPDSSRYYFNQLKGEKLIRYIPNTDHSLGGSDAIKGIGAFYWSVVYDKPRPQITWQFTDDGAIEVSVNTKPTKAVCWFATNKKARDFRLEIIGKAWQSKTLKPTKNGKYVAKIKRPARGFSAFLIELTFDNGGPFPYKFSTQVRVVPDVLPHARNVPAGD